MHQFAKAHHKSAILLFFGRAFGNAKSINIAHATILLCSISAVRVWSSNVRILNIQKIWGGTRSSVYKHTIWTHTHWNRKTFRPHFAACLLLNANRCVRATTFVCRIYKHTCMYCDHVRCGWLRSRNWKTGVIAIFHIRNAHHACSVYAPGVPAGHPIRVCSSLYLTLCWTCTRLQSTNAKQCDNGNVFMLLDIRERTKTKSIYIALRYKIMCWSMCWE